MSKRSANTAEKRTNLERKSALKKQIWKFLSSFASEVRNCKSAKFEARSLQFAAEESEKVLRKQDLF